MKASCVYACVPERGRKIVAAHPLADNEEIDFTVLPSLLFRLSSVLQVLVLAGETFRCSSSSTSIDVASPLAASNSS